MTTNLEVQYRCEIEFGIRELHKSSESRAGGSTRRNCEARTRVPGALTPQSEPTRAEAETKGQVFRFGPRAKVLVDRFCLPILADEFGISQPLAHNLPYQKPKAILVAH